MQAPPFIRRYVQAALLDVDLYNEVEADATLNRQAAAVVAIATALTGLGSVAAMEVNVFVGIVTGVVTGLMGWLVWSAISLIVGTRLFSGTSDYGEMLRVIGFAYAPLAIGVIPWLGFIGALWSLVAAVIAVREGLDFSTGRAVVTMATGWGLWLLLAVAVQAAIGFELAGDWPF
jgi:hypothetical protein